MNATLPRDLASPQACAARQTADERSVAQEVRTTFALVGIVPASQLALPSVTLATGRECAVTVRKAVLELIQEGYVDNELMALIECANAGSLAGLQLALQEKLRDAYIANHAADVAEVRQ